MKRPFLQRLFFSKPAALVLIALVLLCVAVSVMIRVRTPRKDMFVVTKGDNLALGKVDIFRIDS